MPGEGYSLDGADPGVEGIKGYRYVIMFVDITFHKQIAYYVKDKSAMSLKEAVEYIVKGKIRQNVIPKTEPMSG